MNYTCPICIQVLKSGQDSIQCATCLYWVHQSSRKSCSGLTTTEFLLHCKDDSKLWECDKCICKSFMSLPFMFDYNEENFWLNDMNKNISNINQNNLSDDINLLISDKNKDFVAQCDSMVNILEQNDDIDDNHVINPSTKVNSKYYDIKQLNTLKIDDPTSFGLFHVNIASLDKHIDDLKFILSQLKPNFSILGISEHKIIKNSLPSNNIKISGYKDFIFEPTESTCGGTGFYIKDNLDHILRSDLQINSPADHESIFLEI